MTLDGSEQDEVDEDQSDGHPAGGSIGEDK